MKLLLFNTPTGLKPVYDEDYDEKKKLKIGEYYTADIKLTRNLDFHRKYFALINAAYELLPEDAQKGFRTADQFRKYVEVASGHSELFYSPKIGDYVEIPKSISFDKMDQAEFEDLYSRVRNTIDAILAPRITREAFENILMNF